MQVVSDNFTFSLDDACKVPYHPSCFDGLTGPGCVPLHVLSLCTIGCHCMSCHRAPLMSLHVLPSHTIGCPSKYPPPLPSGGMKGTVFGGMSEIGRVPTRANCRAHHTGAPPRGRTTWTSQGPSPPCRGFHWLGQPICLKRTPRVLCRGPVGRGDCGTRWGDLSTGNRDHSDTCTWVVCWAIPSLWI